MGLSVYLEGQPFETECYCAECGNTHKRTASAELYWANITHNLGTMAEKAGIYEALWRPHKLKEGYNIPDNDHDTEWKFEEENKTTAADITPYLKKGLADLKSRPEYFEQFNASNGWGLYEHFVPFVEKYLEACIENPDAIVRVSR